MYEEHIMDNGMKVCFDVKTALYTEDIADATKCIVISQGLQFIITTSYTEMKSKVIIL